MMIQHTLLPRIGSALVIIGLLSIFLFRLNIPSTSPSILETSPNAAYMTPVELPIAASSTAILTATTASTTTAVAAKTPVVRSAAVYQKIPSTMEIMAWIYPGKPTCGAASEYADGRKIDVLKPEYFMIGEAGELVLLTEKERGCNGYSAKNIASLQKYSKEQYATISSSDAGNMGLFLTDTEKASAHINILVSFVVDNRMTGIELDFENFGGWDQTMYTDYKQFVTQLGNALHEKKKKLMIDGPATSNAVEQAWYVWRYADFVTLPVDRIVVMTYDYQFDQGAGQPISPIVWIQNTIKWTRSAFPNASKLSFGIPSYGYRGTDGAQKFSLLTYEQIQKEPGFSTAVRDKDSFEMTWRMGDNVYFFQDAVSMSEKLRTIQAAGISSVSVWHVGGNPWFTK